jgi:hypothetical protein
MPRDLMHDVTPGVTRDMTRDLLRQSQSQSQSQKPIPTSHGRQLARSFDCLNYRPRARKTDKAMNTTTNHAHGASAGASTRALGLKVGDKVVVTFEAEVDLDGDFVTSPKKDWITSRNTAILSVVKVQPPFKPGDVVRRKIDHFTLGITICRPAYLLGETGCVVMGTAHTRRDYGPEGIAGFSPDEYELVEVPS